MSSKRQASAESTLSFCNEAEKSDSTEPELAPVSSTTTTGTTGEREMRFCDESGDGKATSGEEKSKGKERTGD